MIDYVRIRGFQSLEDVSLSLGRFTVLVGPSNSGKSAIRRALEAVTTNAAPAGRLRTGSDQITVEVATETGRVIWEKGPKRNAYTVNTDAGTVVQDKPGAKATPEVAAVLGLDADNFSDQFDRPFLLADTASAVAGALGELTNITVLFDAQREANRQRADHARRAATLDQQLTQARETLASYDDLPEEDRRLRDLAVELAQVKAAQDAYVRLRVAAQQAAELAATVRTQEDTLAATVDPAPALELLDQADLARAEAADLQLGADAARRLKAQATAEVPSAVELPPLLAEHATAAAHLGRAVEQARQLAATVLTHESAIGMADDDLGYAQAALAQFDVCPLCGTTGVHLEAS